MSQIHDLEIPSRLSTRFERVRASGRGALVSAGRAAIVCVGARAQVLAAAGRPRESALYHPAIGMAVGRGGGAGGAPSSPWLRR